MPVRRWSSHGPASQTTSPAKPNRTTRTPVGRSAGVLQAPPTHPGRAHEEFKLFFPHAVQRIKAPAWAWPTMVRMAASGATIRARGAISPERSSQPQPRASRDPVSTPTTCEARRCHCWTLHSPPPRPGTEIPPQETFGGGLSTRARDGGGETRPPRPVGGRQLPQSNSGVRNDQLRT